jgi:hypothetical protein
MRELNMAWRLLKNVSSSDDYGDVSTSLDNEERMKVEAIKRKNAEARKRLENPSYNLPPFRQRDSSKRAKMRPKPVEIANIMDSPERMQRLNPTANFADGSAPPVPQNNPNPLDLSMESLKRLNEGR